MHFALLCDDQTAKPIVDALNDGGTEHRLTCAVRITPKSDDLLHGCRDIAYAEHWEDLLIAKDVDAVIVGGSDPKILEGAKQLAAARIPLLFIASSDQGSTFAYEMSLIHDDNQVELYPAFLHRFDAAVVQLKSAITRGELGRIQYLQLNRSLPRPTAGIPIPQSEVDAELLNDIDIPRWLIGDYNQITALQTAATSDSVLMQTVVLSGRSLPEFNWSLTSVAGQGEWKLAVQGEKGTAELTYHSETRQWTSQVNGVRTEGNAQVAARNLITDFVIKTNSGSNVSENQRTASIEWGELIKCFETLDATYRSVRRRRTIELHFEPMSERAIFKTQMTAIGCGILIGTLLLLLCYLGIASIVPLPPNVLVCLRTLIFLPLGIFLLAQFLLLLTRPSSH